MLQDLEKRFKDASEKVAILEARLQQRMEARDRFLASLNEAKAEAQQLAQVESVLLHLSSKVVANTSARIDRRVTEALRAVFTDHKFEFVTTTSVMRGKSAVEFVLRDDGKEFPIQGSYGGGILSVIGVMLRVVTILMYKGRRLLVLDETLAKVAEAYIPNVSALLRVLCEELDFTILCVTHSSLLAAHAHNRYEASQQGGVTVYKKVDPSTGKAISSRAS